MSPQAQRSYGEWYEILVDAYRQEDFAAMAAAAQGALETRPGYPAMLLNLAVARARNGQPGAAVDLLERLAAMGLAFDVAEAADFASLSGSERFRAAAARLRANGEPFGNAVVAFALEDREFFPEGLAYDPGSGSFFLGSVRTGVVLQVSAAGETREFARARLGVFGMRVDAERGHLWAATSAVAQRRDLDPESLGGAGILRLDLDSGEQLSEHLLPPDGAEHVLGDLVVGADGAVYASDSVGGGVWALRPGERELAELVRPGRFVSPQGLDLEPGGRRLYLADYRRGIFAIDTEGGQVVRLLAPETISTYGFDGLYWYGGGLIGIQNAFAPHGVVRLVLDSEGVAIVESETLISADPRFDEPTLGVVVGDDLFLVANSPWGYFADPADPPDPEELPAPTVLRVSL